MLLLTAFTQLLATGLDLLLLCCWREFCSLSLQIPKTHSTSLCPLTIFAVDGLDHQVRLEGVLHLLAAEVIQVLPLNEITFLLLQR